MRHVANQRCKKSVNKRQIDLYLLTKYGMLLKRFIQFGTDIDVLATYVNQFVTSEISSLARRTYLNKSVNTTTTDLAYRCQSLWRALRNETRKPSSKRWCRWRGSNLLIALTGWSRLNVKPRIIIVMEVTCSIVMICRNFSGSIQRSISQVTRLVD